MAKAKDIKPDVADGRRPRDDLHENRVDVVDYENDDEQPLSLAEELASEGRNATEDIHDRYERIKQEGDTNIAELQKMSMGELIEQARDAKLADCTGVKKQDLIFRIDHWRLCLCGKRNTKQRGNCHPEGYHCDNSASQFRLFHSRFRSRRARRLPYYPYRAYRSIVPEKSLQPAKSR